MHNIIEGLHETLDGRYRRSVILGNRERDVLPGGYLQQCKTDTRDYILELIGTAGNGNRSRPGSDRDTGILRRLHGTQEINLKLHSATTGRSQIVGHGDFIAGPRFGTRQEQAIWCCTAGRILHHAGTDASPGRIDCRGQAGQGVVVTIDRD